MELLVRRPTWAAGRTDGSWGRLDLAPLAHGELDDEGIDVDLSPLAVEMAAEVRVAALSPAERDVLSRGAVFGGVFWTGAVVALGRVGGAPADDAAVFAPDPAIAEIRGILERLAERDFVVRLEESSLPGETAWGFKHAREQTLVEASVEPALARRRRLFAAQWLESRAGQGREERLEALAKLYEGGGDARRATYCYATAAADARARHLLDRAHVLYGAAVRLMNLDDAVAKMDALYALGDLAARLGRTHEAVAHFGEMLRLAWRLDLPAKGGAAHGRLGRLHGTLGAPRQALVHLELAKRLFEVAGDAAGVAAALDDIGRIHLVSGAPETSLAFHRAALTVREQLGDARGRALALARLGQVEQETGNLVAAGEHFRAALVLRRQVGDRQGEVASLLDLGGLALDLGAIDEAVARLEEGRALAREHGERLFEASLAIELGECHLAAGQPLRARREYQSAQEIARRFGARVLSCEATRGLAEAELALGDLRRARDDARAAFDLAERMGAAPLVGAALRVVAAAVGLGAPGEADLGGAREMFDRAVEVLSNAGAELELARTLAAYADFEASVGRKETAQELKRQADTIRAQSRGPKRKRAGRNAPELALH
jgi:tetratricopeptide (TPR) repeat protein